MQYSEPLIPARLVRRYKRFLADLVLEDGTEITAHCANPGSMLSLAEPGRRCWLSHDPNPRRKLAYSWELEETPAGCVGINTARANQVVAEALSRGAIPELARWPVVRREVADGGGSRLDFQLSGPDGAPCWLEVKSVTLSRQTGLAEWPDSRSARGLRHLESLTALAAGGAAAALLFLVQRPDCTAFRAAAGIDPAYASALAAVLTRPDGAKSLILAYDCEISPRGIELRRRVDIIPN
ncbi:MAG TPA: DNA/RNA nuclease SfsA [Alphaproteobacteria bacterium]|nr:DNA/RNA nuclease SfsA [Alphaproteobacteria bacterium]